MRIWSPHQKYLDTKGLLALWRETLLAKHVLEGKTMEYTNHLQLLRFKQMNFANKIAKKVVRVKQCLDLNNEREKTS